MWNEIHQTDQTMILAELDEDLRDRTADGWLPAELALQLQIIRDQKRLREEVGGLSREVWLLKEGRGG